MYSLGFLYLDIYVLKKCWDHFLINFFDNLFPLAKLFQEIIFCLFTLPGTVSYIFCFLYSLHYILVLILKYIYVYVYIYNFTEQHSKC